MASGFLEFAYRALRRFSPKRSLKKNLVLCLGEHAGQVRDNYIADVIVRIQGLSGDSTKDVKTSCCAKHSMPIAADMQDADSSTCMNLELPSRASCLYAYSLKRHDRVVSRDLSRMLSFRRF